MAAWKPNAEASRRADSLRRVRKRLSDSETHVRRHRERELAATKTARESDREREEMARMLAIEPVQDQIKHAVSEVYRAAIAKLADEMMRQTALTHGTRHDGMAYIVRVRVPEFNFATAIPRQYVDDPRHRRVG